jgi:hypothetical protein
MPSFEAGRLCRCGDCDDCLFYKDTMSKREAAAREVKHCVVAMHKSNLIVVTDREILKQLNRPGRTLGN